MRPLSLPPSRAPLLAMDHDADCGSTKVYTFGNGDHGKLGHGDVRKVSVPTLVERLVKLHVIKVRTAVGSMRTWMALG